MDMEWHVRKAKWIPCKLLLLSCLLFVHSHSGGGQVSVLLFQLSVQCKSPFVLVFSQQGGDAQSIFVGAFGLHCLSVEDKTQTNPFINIPNCVLMLCFYDTWYLLWFLVFCPPTQTLRSEQTWYICLLSRGQYLWFGPLWEEGNK